MKGPNDSIKIDATRPPRETNLHNLNCVSELGLRTKAKL